MDFMAATDASRSPKADASSKLVVPGRWPAQCCCAGKSLDSATVVMIAAVMLTGGGGGCSASDCVAGGQGQTQPYRIGGRLTGPPDPPGQVSLAPGYQLS